MLPRIGKSVRKRMIGLPAHPRVMVQLRLKRVHLLPVQDVPLLREQGQLVIPLAYPAKIIPEPPAARPHLFDLRPLVRPPEGMLAIKQDDALADRAWRSTKVEGVQLPYVAMNGDVCIDIDGSAAIARRFRNGEPEHGEVRPVTAGVRPHMLPAPVPISSPIGRV